ncbi:DUF4190 domain-containing protein [Cellulomonas iranensis]|uniref:DUF4190 domain-containing protein n=1 Tax=Cellulomonas iranensis TaxID=76862 RepID=UPI003D7E1A54
MSTPTPPPYGTPPGPGTPPPYGTPPAAAPYGASPYGAGPYGQPYVARRTNPFAIAAFVTGLLGFALIPVVLGHMGLAQIRRTGDGGGWMAVIGLVLGYGMCLVYAAMVLLVGGSLWWGTR